MKTLTQRQLQNMWKSGIELSLYRIERDNRVETARIVRQYLKDKKAGRKDGIDLGQVVQGVMLLESETITLNIFIHEVNKLEPGKRYK